MRQALGKIRVKLFLAKKTAFSPYCDLPLRKVRALILRIGLLGFLFMIIVYYTPKTLF